MRNLRKDRFEKDVDDAVDKVKAGTKVVKNKVESVAKDLGNKAEKIHDDLETDYKKEKFKEKWRK